MPAICVSGNKSDHVCPFVAFKNLLDARALASSAADVIPISLGVPVLPLVATSREISDFTDFEEVGPHPRAGPTFARACISALTFSARARVGSRLRTSRCEDVSIARVGYRV